MICPVCKDYRLVAEEVEQGLVSRDCPSCKGRWIGSYHYWKWHEVSGKSLAAVPPQDEALSVDDSTGAKLCPECGHFLRRYPVGRGVDFGLDRCGNCGGMWFDRNEWETLKSRSLHDDVHKIFSEIWQRQIRDEARQAAMEAFYKDKFGDDDYQKAIAIKHWLNAHPHASTLRAFLGL